MPANLAITASLASLAVDEKNGLKNELEIFLRK
jgi:hypothetical protein